MSRLMSISLDSMLYSSVFIQFFCYYIYFFRILFVILIVVVPNFYKVIMFF